jgi:NAD-dependent dihydropyrimidine dehydrogenase PreA subunit
MAVAINIGKCNGCALCDLYCPLDVIHMESHIAVVRYPEECWHCGVCRQVCPKDAVTVEFSPTMLGV